MLNLIKKNWQILLVIFTIIILWCWPEDDLSVYDVSKYVEQIDSLQSKIDSISVLGDSVDQRIDTITIIVEKTHIQYEKDRTTILNNTTNEDYLFFLEYVRENRARFDSIYNF